MKTWKTADFYKNHYYFMLSNLRGANMMGLTTLCAGIVFLILVLPLVTRGPNFYFENYSPNYFIALWVPFIFLFLAIFGTYITAKRYFYSEYALSNDSLRGKIVALGGRVKHVVISLNDILAIQVQIDDMVVIHYRSDNLIGTTAMNVFLPSEARYKFLCELILVSPELEKRLCFSKVIFQKSRDITLKNLEKILLDR